MSAVQIPRAADSPPQACEQGRLAHFERLKRATNAVTILLAGVVLVGASYADVRLPWWTTLLAVVGAVFNVADLVTGFGEKADAHRDLKRRYSRASRV